VSEGVASLLGPYVFALTREEATAAAARAGFRATLAGRLSRSHIAPLVAFALFVLFIAILSFTGLLARRFGEAALLLAAIVFMTSRMAAHWRLRGAQRSSLAAALAMHAAGRTVVSVEASGLRFENFAGSRTFAFADCETAEDAGGMIYLWLRDGEPGCIPAKAFANAQAAQDFLAFVRANIKRGGRT
jgi:hypothetical protein